ncbi:MAG: N-acetylmuramoyl-L-alanine amidase [Bacteroidales bacterium]
MRYFLLLCVFFVGITTNAHSQDSYPKRLKKIVIDPGHGGDKPGAIGKISKEKDLNLAISLKLGELINQHLKPVEVVYTRKTDHDVDLIRRSQLANREKADMFISIHCNASSNRDASGTETFVMGLAKTQANIEAAKKENADILMEANYAEKYDGFDPNSPESNIFFAFYQNAYLEQSLVLASKIQGQFISNTKMLNRGVKQAPYLVLYKTSVPAILTEVGFISNHKEEIYLNSQIGQYEIAASLFIAIQEYKDYMEGVKRPLPSIASLIPHKAIKAEKLAREKENAAKLLAQKLQESLEQEFNMPDTIINKCGLVYRVQFYTDKTKHAPGCDKFKGLDSVWMYNTDDLWKYTSGAFKDFQSANDYRDKIKEKGYKDAFVVIFNNDERISLAKAKEIENNIKK